MYYKINESVMVQDADIIYGSSMFEVFSVNYLCA